jgi:flavin-dependent dehydrogenase
MTGQYDAVVIGGGPAGCMFSIALARRGRRVLLLDRERFPRYHVGESLTPVVCKALQSVGAGADVEAAGFVPKGGATFVWGPHRQAWSVYYGEAGQEGGALQARRTEFDHVLLQHAASSGVEVREGCRVQEVLFEGDRAVGVAFGGRGSAPQVARASWTVDASGQEAVLAHQLGLVEPHPRLRGTAVWSYWAGGGRLEGRDAGNSLFVSHGAGCWWYIPVEDQASLISVGVLAPPSAGGPIDDDPDRFYRQAISDVDVIPDLLAGARQAAPVRTAPASAYRASQLAGPGWMLAGDAAFFVDPILSPGVQLACGHGSLAATAVDSVLDEPELEAAALEWYERHCALQYDTFVELCRNLYGAAGFFPGGRPQPEGDRLAFLSLISGLSGQELPGALGGYIARRKRAAARGGPPPVLGEEEGFQFLTRWFHELRLRHGRAGLPGEDLEVDSIMRAAPGARIADEVFLPAGEGGTLRRRRAVSNRFGDRFEPTRQLEALLEALNGECAYHEVERQVCKALDLDPEACSDGFRRWVELLADHALVEWRRPTGRRA